MSEWIEWSGGECPVANDTLVEVRYRNGPPSEALKAVDWDWMHRFGGSDIVAYRIVKPAKIKSDGGQTDYYKLPEHATELRHLISAKGMSKSRGDIFKACYRLGEKDGSDVLYDLNKIKFFAQDLIEMYERGEHI